MPGPIPKVSELLGPYFVYFVFNISSLLEASQRLSAIRRFVDERGGI